MSAPRTLASAVAASGGAAANAGKQLSAKEAANKEAAKASLSDLDAAALDLDSDTITTLRLDGLALTKIVKHSRDAHPQSAPGVLLGMEIGSALEVSNVFALPKGALGGSSDEAEDSDRGPKAAARYTSHMLRLLRDVNADANPVGLYKSCFLGSFLSSSLIDGLGALASLMEGSDGQGRGIILIHGECSAPVHLPPIQLLMNVPPSRPRTVCSGQHRR
jgi:translation initiation factor 3 subunit H